MIGQRQRPSSAKKLGGFMLSEENWSTALRDHQHRVKVMKPAIQIDEPWGMGGRPRRPIKPATARGDARRPEKSCGGSTPRSARGQSAQRSAPRQKQAAPPPVPRAPTGIDDLSPEKQAICEDMIAVLMSLDEEGSYSVAQELFVLAEERRLLNRYTGVFPAMAEELPEDGTSRDEADQHEPSTQAADDTTRNAASDDSLPPAAPAKSESGSNDDIDRYDDDFDDDASNAPVDSPPKTNAQQSKAGRPQSAKRRSHAK